MPPTFMPAQFHVEKAVKERYSAAAQTRVESLCCPVHYDARYLKVIPPEILERDYGCGDPSQYLNSGEAVLDLGSGAGKICFIASQVVGPEGRVIGVDMNDERLLAGRMSSFARAEFRIWRWTWTGLMPICNAIPFAMLRHFWRSKPEQKNSE
jgi:arsenite methyltransferase